MTTKIKRDELTAEEQKVWDETGIRFDYETIDGKRWIDHRNAYLSDRLAKLDANLFHGIGDRAEVNAEIEKAQDAFEAGDWSEFYEGDAYSEDRLDACRSAVAEYRRSH